MQVRTRSGGAIATKQSAPPAQPRAEHYYGSTMTAPEYAALRRQAREERLAAQPKGLTAALKRLFEGAAFTAVTLALFVGAEWLPNAIAEAVCR